jgi:hypothetical protein
MAKIADLGDVNVTFVRIRFLRNPLNEGVPSSNDLAINRAQRNHEIELKQSDRIV